MIGRTAEIQRIFTMVMVVNIDSDDNFHNDDSAMTVEAVTMIPMISVHVTGVKCTTRESLVKGDIIMQRRATSRAVEEENKVIRITGMMWFIERLWPHTPFCKSSKQSNGYPSTVVTCSPKGYIFLLYLHI